MRIAIATDQDFVSACFGCCSACTIIDIEAGRIQGTLVVPNPGWQHSYWADLLQRNSVTALVVGHIGENATAVLKWRGVQVISGVEGQIDEVINRYLAGVLLPAPDTCGIRKGENCRLSKTS